jgi:CheY-like chemotaxis protein
MLTSAAQSGVRELSCKRLLVVEDDEDSAELLRLVLSSAGYQVCVVHSVAAALETAPILQPHVALIDLGLPDGDGYELLASLQANSGPLRCRFVATTGDSAPETMARSLSLGFDEHLTKPLSLEIVLATVARCAAGHSLGPATKTWSRR